MGTPASRVDWGHPQNASLEVPPSQKVRGVQALNTFLRKGEEREKVIEIQREIPSEDGVGERRVGRGEGVRGRLQAGASAAEVRPGRGMG